MQHNTKKRITIVTLFSFISRIRYYFWLSLFST